MTKQTRNKQDSVGFLSMPSWTPPLVKLSPVPTQAETTKEVVEA